ncbi:MAG: hypothetical protein QM704_04295 [Anaeromyxobacteraceae bacterium]
MSRLGPLAALLPLALAACVSNPYSGTAVAPGSTAASFAGFQLRSFAGETIRVEVERPSGAWTLLGEAPVDRFNGWFATVAVPDDAWRLPPCGAARFRFTDAPSGYALAGLSAACMDPLGPSPSLGQAAACLVPTVELFRGQVHAGNLVVDGQADADAHACVTVVQGDLTVVGDRQPGPQGTYAPGVTFTMTNLAEVTGSLTVDGGRTTAFRLPRLARVGGDLTMLSTQFITLTTPSTGQTQADTTATRFDLQRLAAVGGSVSLRDAKDGSLAGSAPDHDFGLDGLWQLGGDLRIEVPVFPSRVVGLRGLAEAPRDVVLDLGATDVNAPTLLPDLARVKGALSLTVNPRAQAILPALGRVDGSVTITPQSSAMTIFPGFLPLLAEVGGEVRITGTTQPCGQAWLPALRAVGGMLRLTGGSPEGAVGATGATPLVLGGLLVSGTDAAVVPVHPDVQVTGKGPVIFTTNPRLCPCLSLTLGASLASRGWTGVVQEGGNGAAASCAGLCPALTCP